ncbi:FkbM family methyltransferase [Paraburkholderia sp. 35.1]|uniref:FkbM family methyltransferase n=1 Tax=Paraburkholderia sp. 35.1 TaxID=2991058 RepID=UPI003D22B673
MANNTGIKEAFESRVSELQQENELLLVQLHHAQEELERNYSRAQPAASKLTTSSNPNVANASTIANKWVADELPEMYAENRRLRALVDAQKKIHERESNHALNARLGNILIEGVDAPGSLFLVPGKLVKIWRQSTRRTPPAVLGGKDFSKIIAAWQSGGFNAVEKAMGAQPIAPAMQAQGYTALARHLGKGDRANAAEAARRAYDLDPKAFRLKWLAFRLHEAGDVVEAEAMLELLPVDAQFSESEARQAKQLRNEAKRARDSEAKQKTAFAERRAAADKQLSNLARERDQQFRLATDRAREVVELKQSKAKLEQEKAMLSARYESQASLLDQRNCELEAFKQANSQLQKENVILVAERDQSEMELRDALDASIRKSGDNESLLASLHLVQEELESLQAAKATVEQELRALEVKHEVERRIAEERLRELDALRQTKALLEQEKQSLTEGRETQARLAEERERELTSLKQATVKLEQEKAALEKLKQTIVPKANKGDADIDDLLADLELFFNGKAIIYVDVGAYVGDVFLKIKRSSKKFRIHEAHLFEPNPNSYARLMSKIAGSDSPVVHAYNLAIAESSDAHRFIPAKSMTKALSADLVSEIGPDDVFTARCVSLDSQAPIFTDGKINLLKIDVEGKEMDVLASARKLFESQSVDIIYIEVGFNRSGTQQTYFAEVDQFLQAFGYRVLRIYEQKEEWMRDSPLLRRANIAYMSERFANAHPLKLMQELQELKNRLNELTGGVLKAER